MAAVIGALRADLSANVAQFEQDMGAASKAVEAFAKRAEATSKALSSIGSKMSLAITAPFIALSFKSLQGAKDATAASAQVQNALDGMGGASGKTLVELQAMAKELRNFSTFDDNDILNKSTANLLRFGNVSGQVFNRASAAIVDMSARSGDLETNTKLVGKALNDPMKAIKQLNAVGITFTEAQQKMIEKFVSTNNVAGAQGVILGELERRYAGAAKAARDSDPWANLRDIWRDIQTVLQDLAMRFLPPLIAAVERLGKAFLALSPEMQTFVVGVVAAAAALGPLLVGLGAIVGVVGQLAPVWGAFLVLFKDAALAAGIADMGIAVKAFTTFLTPWIGVLIAAVAAMWQFRGAFYEAFDRLVSHFQGTVVPAFERLKAALADLFAGLDVLMSGPLGKLVRFVAWAVAELSALFLEGLGHVIVAVIGTMVDLVTTAIKAVTHLVDIVSKLLTGDFAGAWEATKDLVIDVITGILQAFENIVPGITEAATAAYQAVSTWIGEGIANVLNWIEGRFPGLVDAMAGAARGAIAWAKNLYEGVKAWINDNLGPAIQWAKDRIRELQNLFGWVRQRQTQVEGGRPSTPRPAPAPPRSAGGGGAGNPDGGFGGGGGGKGRKGKSDAEKLAEKIAKATKKFRESLEDVQTAIDRAFDRNVLPRSMQQAKALRLRIAELTEEAKEAGVATGGFADEIARLQMQINELETKGLEREAKAFARDVRDMAGAVVDLGGGLPPLDDKLRSIDDTYADLRKEIEDSINENRKLAEVNTEAAAAMAILERQLNDLDAAHAKATAGAKAQHDAEQRLLDLQAAADAEDTRRAIQDLRERRGEGSTLSAGLQQLKEIERDLADQRMKAAEELAALENRKLQAQANGDVQELARIEQAIALQQQLFDLVSNTTAVQIRATDRLQKAFESFVDGLSDELTGMIMDWEFDLNGIRNVFKQIARDLFIKPVVDSFSTGIGSFLKSFAGGFAVGGTLSPGTWGIAGENGPEPIFAGAQNLSVMTNESAFGRGRGDVIFNVQTPNADSFRYSQRQLARKAKQTLG